MKVSEKLKQFLEENGITQSFVSEKTGIAASTLSEIFNGKRKLYIERLVAICRAIGQNPSLFIDEVEK